MVEGQVDWNCEGEICKRVCDAGYTALAPRKTTCNKVSAGVFEWSKELGGCAICPDPNFKDSVNAACKINGSTY